ncbi:MAG: S8/S53 family peptidase, partial [Pseudomonadota bacterium]
MRRSRKTSVAIDPAALAAAQKHVSAVRAKLQAERRRRLGSIAAKIDRLQTLARARRKEAADRRRQLGKAIATARKQTAEDARLSKKMQESRKLLGEECGDRPLRIFVECTKAEKLKAVTAAAVKALSLGGRAKEPEVAYLYPRLVKKHRDLRRFMIVEVHVNRRRGIAIGPRISDAIRRTGMFLSVRIEGLRSGVASGPPTTGTGPNYDFARPDRHDWHLTNPENAFLDFNLADGRDYIGAIDAYGAWDVLGVDRDSDGTGAGAGIVIGHPDTGYLPHEDYPESRVDTVRAYDAFLNASAALAEFEGLEGIGRHPLQPNMLPYLQQHGTMTASAIVAPNTRSDRPEQELTGVAPGATILPLRCVETVVLAGDLEIIRAIEFAIFMGVDVISISLGGSPNPGLLAALQTAIANGIIVVAAAGQPQGFPLPNQVVAPAAWPDVIAVGGSIGGRAWFGAFSGPEVDFCAPAVQVRRAAFENDGTETEGSGRGTSFATALTAGAAALWLQHHGGRAAVEAAVPGVSVQEVFRHLARETAYIPSSLQATDTDPIWPAGFGTGILNVCQLLKADLPAPGDVAGARRFMPPNVYVSGSGIALLDLNGRPVLDGIIMLQNAPMAIGTAVVGAGRVIGDLISDLTAGTSVAANAVATTWLGAVGSVRSIGEAAVAA